MSPLLPTQSTMRWTPTELSAFSVLWSFAPAGLAAPNFPALPQPPVSSFVTLGRLLPSH